MDWQLAFWITLAFLFFSWWNNSWLRGQNHELYKKAWARDQAAEITHEFVSQRGHNRCWYYPDLFNRLALLFGVQCSPHRLPPREEFRANCLKYEEQEYMRQDSHDRIFRNLSKIFEQPEPFQVPMPPPPPPIVSPPPPPKTYP